MIRSARIADAGIDDADGEPTRETADCLCPLCGLATESPDQTYTHLQISHKKSELAGMVVEW